MSDVLKSFQKWLGIPDLDWGLIPRVPTWLAILAPLAFAYYKYSTWHFGVFTKLGINGPKPVPIFGTSFSLMQNGLIAHDMMLKKYGSVVGTFQGRTPMMFVYDVDILKQILVKEFTNFSDRIDLPISGYPVGKILFKLKGDHWRHVRSVLSPAFSSGKLRKMNGQIHKCAETLVKNLMEKANKGETFDFRAFCAAYTMDVIASTAFGIEIDSHNDPNNLFVKMGQRAFQATFASPLIIAFFFFPFLLKPFSMLGYTIFPRDCANFFVEVMNKSLEQRKQGNTAQDRVDFLQLISDARIDDTDADDTAGEPDKSTKGKDGDKQERAGNKKGLTHEEVLSQGFFFFLAGFETTANTLSLLVYSLATHPACQERLLREIDDVIKDHDQVDYDVVHKMTYLDMCLSETLRLYPAGPRSDRVTLNDITINGVFFPKGMTIASPIYVLHMDPSVWSEPTKFNPERFTAEEKEARNPYYYMPFGVGPRNCVGMRLALTELKMAAVSILRNLKFVVCPETQIPLKLDKLAMRGVDGIKLRVEKRQK